MRPNLSKKKNHNYKLTDIPEDISAFELFYTLKLKFDIRIQEIRFSKQNNKTTDLGLKESEVKAMVLEYLVKSNRMLFMSDFGDKKEYTEKISRISKQQSQNRLLSIKNKNDLTLDKFIDRTDLSLSGKNLYKIKTNGGVATLLTISDMRVDSIFMQDFWIKNYLVKPHILLSSYTINKDFKRQTHFDRYKSGCCFLENFCLSIHKDKLFKYWDFNLASNLYTKPLLLFNCELLQKKTPRYFSFDIMFTIDSKVDIKISIEFSKLCIYDDDDLGKRVIHAYLIRHPCLYYDLCSFDKYKDLQLRNWKRIPNFFMNNFNDEIIKIISGSNSVLTMEIVSCNFNSNFNSFLKVVDNFGKKQMLHSNFEIRNFNEFRLKFSTDLIIKSNISEQIKFMILVNISYEIIDITSFDESFLEILGKYPEQLTLSAMQFIIFNSKNQQKRMSLQEYKLELKDKLELLSVRNKICDPTKEKYVLDTNLHSKIIQITPSCHFYSLVERNKLFSLSDFEEKIEEFLGVKFVDEDLSIISEYSSALQLHYLNTYGRKFKLLNDEYEFFYISPEEAWRRLAWYKKKNSRFNYGKIYKLVNDISENDITEQSSNFSESLSFKFDHSVLPLLDYHESGYDIIKLGNQNINIDYFDTEIVHFGFISSEILKDFEKIYLFDYISCLFVRLMGREIHLLRKKSEKKILELPKDPFKIDKISIETFQILEIGRYKSLYLNPFLLKNLEKMMIEQFNEGTSILIELAREFLEKLDSQTPNYIESLIEHPNGQKSETIKLLIDSKNEILDVFVKRIHQSIKIKGRNALKRLNVFTPYSCQLMAVKDPFSKLKKGSIFLKLKNDILIEELLIISRPGDKLSDYKSFRIDLNLDHNYQELENIIIYSKDDECFFKSSRLNDVIVIWNHKIIQPFFEFSQKRSDKIPKKSTNSEILSSNLANEKETKLTKGMSLFYESLKVPSIFHIELLFLAETEFSNEFQKPEFYDQIKELKNAYFNGLVGIDQSSFAYLERFNQNLKKQAFATYLDLHNNNNIKNLKLSVGKIYMFAISISSNKRNSIQDIIIEELITDDYPKYLKSALKLLILYNYDINLLMNFYDFDEESEFFLGKPILDFKPISFSSRYLSQSKFLPGNFLLSDYVRIIEEKYRLKFFDPRKENSVKMDDLLHRASAMYVASKYYMWEKYERFKTHLNDAELSKLLKYVKQSSNSREIKGFAWVSCGKYLLKLLEIRAMKKEKPFNNKMNDI